MLNEFDDHALEEALLLKEEAGGTVTAYAIGNAEEVEQMLHTAIAKGADSATMLGEDLDALDARAHAAAFADEIAGEGYDLVLSGVQASDELEGQVTMLVAATLGLPHMSVVVSATPNGDALKVTKEYWGGITAGLSRQPAGGARDPNSQRGTAIRRCCQDSPSSGIRCPQHDRSGCTRSLRTDHHHRNAAS